jgi:hypothetical protein
MLYEARLIELYYRRTRQHGDIVHDGLAAIAEFPTPMRLHEGAGQTAGEGAAVTLRRSATVLDVARLLHKDLAQSLSYARVGQRRIRWPTGRARAPSGGSGRGGAAHAVT